jgi:hypothetical protein
VFIVEATDEYDETIGNSRVMLQIVVSLTDDSRGIIYSCNEFIVEVTDEYDKTIGNSRAMLQIVASLMDDSRGVIYSCNVFIVEATDEYDEMRIRRSNLNLPRNIKFVFFQ